MWKELFSLVPFREHVVFVALGILPDWKKKPNNLTQQSRAQLQLVSSALVACLSFQNVTSA